MSFDIFVSATIIKFNCYSAMALAGLYPSTLVEVRFISEDGISVTEGNSKTKRTSARFIISWGSEGTVNPPPPNPMWGPNVALRRL